MGHLLEVAYGFGVVDELDEAAVGTVGDYRVGFHPYFYVLFLEDFVYEGYQLHCHVLLPEVVA